MSQNSFSESFDAILGGIDRYISSKTVIGDPVKLNDHTVIVPMVDIAFGAASGTFADKKNLKGRVGGGLGGKVTPCAVLVMQGEMVRIITVKSRETLDRIIDLVPEILNRIKGVTSKKEDEKIINEAFDKAVKEAEENS